jgi:hypothetical protein
MAEIFRTKKGPAHHEGTFGFVELFENPSTHNLIAVKFIGWDVSDGSSALFCEIDALSLLAPVPIPRY